MLKQNPTAIIKDIPNRLYQINQFSYINLAKLFYFNLIIADNFLKTMKPRHIIIKFFLPFVWKISPQRRAYYLQDFELAELDSCWQVMNALNSSPPEIRHKLFHHAIEEFNHFKAFREMKDIYSEKYLIRPILKRQSLLKSNSPKDFIAFLTYVYVGEKEVNSDFFVYANSLKTDLKMFKLYMSLKEDEEGHENQTLNWVKEFSQIHKINTNWLILKNSLNRSYETYKKLITMIGNIPLSFLLFILYFLLTPIAIFEIRKRFKLSRKEELDIFKKHLSHWQSK